VAVTVIVVLPGGVLTAAAAQLVPSIDARPDAPWSVTHDTVTAPEGLAIAPVIWIAVVFTGSGSAVGACSEMLNCGPTGVGVDCTGAP